MEEDDFISYEQDEVELVEQSTRNEIAKGKLRILERRSQPYIQWVCNLDDSDNGWAVIEDTAPTVSYIHQNNSPDAVRIKNCPKPCNIKLSDIKYIRGSEDMKQMVILSSSGACLASFKFHDQHSDFFFEVFHRYVKTRPQDSEKYLFLVQSLNAANIDDKLSNLNLAPVRGKKRLLPHTTGAPYSPVEVEETEPGNANQWVRAPRRVMGFLHDMKRDPYTTALSTLSTVYDVILNGEVAYPEEGTDVLEDVAVAQILHKISGRDDFEPGYELLTKHEQLADRPEVERLSPLTHDEFNQFLNNDGSVNNLDGLKERIFRGGLHHNIRAQVWPLLLSSPPVWNMTSEEREDHWSEKKKEYNTMKLQWKTMSQVQQDNFTGYKDRKSIIEKDVNRVDRNHPFYEGEGNQNLVVLHDILMTYVMYNFDLGYVQGMSDLLAPILYVVQNEYLAFWTFVSHMKRVERNFDIDQSGMKNQLADLNKLLRMLDAEFMSFLEVQDSANLYFCFRWLLVRFKREFNYSDTLRLWEVLWTDRPCINFHLLVAAAILETERNELLESKFGFTDILKHINCLSLSIDLNAALKTAEAMYKQLECSPGLPDDVRSIIGLPPLPKPILMPSQIPRGLPGRATRVSPAEEFTTTPETPTSPFNSKNSKSTEDSFEEAVSNAFL